MAQDTSTGRHEMNEHNLRRNADLEGDNLIVINEGGSPRFYVRHGLTNDAWEALLQRGEDPRSATLFRFVIVDLIYILFHIELMMDPRNDAMPADQLGELAYDGDGFRVYVTSLDDCDEYSFYEGRSGSPNKIGNDCQLLYELASSVARAVIKGMRQVGRSDPSTPFDFITPPWPEVDEVDVSRHVHLIPVHD